MNGSRSSEPPEEPYLRSQPSLLSPASPKPFHFPQPTNIPILEMQMDVDFNQTEVHMSDPSTRNTEVRPDAWRDPVEQAVPATTIESSDANGEETSQVAAASSEPSKAGRDVAQTIAEDDLLSPAQNSVQHVKGFLGDPEGSLAPIPTAPPSSAELLNSDVSALAVVSDPPAPSSQAQIDAELLQEPSAGAVDVQSLLDNLESSLASKTADSNDAPTNEIHAIATASAPPDPATHLSVIEEVHVSGPGLGVLPSGLPPRPPPQEQPNIHPNYVHSQHIRDYHPHAANPAFQPNPRNGSVGNTAESSSTHFVPPAAVSGTQQATPSGVHTSATSYSPSATTSAQAITSPNAAPVLPQTPAAFSANTPIESRRESKLAAGETLGIDDVPWTPETQRKYDRFLEEERKYVNEARWDQFPAGSRLFVGNLSSEKVTKRDIFHVFHSYGELAQISIKQAYGFVQFLRMEDCSTALAGQQGRQIRDKRIHLEVSKPQKSKGLQQSVNRRSRSPDYGRRPGGNPDRYAIGRTSDGRGRDEYRGYRSPSPRGYRDRYDDRHRERSRSPGYGRDDRYRARSPLHDSDDDLPLPRRSLRDVPDVQIIFQSELNRDFIAWVEGHFNSVGVRVGTLRLAPRLSEVAVMKRQVLEGVVAVVKLHRSNQETSKIGLKIFKRQAGDRDVQFEDYDNLDPSICAQLVLREKHTKLRSEDYAAAQYNAPASTPQYGYQPPLGPPLSAGHQGLYGFPPAYATSAPAPIPTYGAPQPPPNINTNNLQHLLTSLHQGSPSTPQNATSANQYVVQQPPSSVVAGGYPSSNTGYGQYPGPISAPPPLNAYPTYPHQQPPQPGQTSQPPNMQDILARLGTYGNR